MAADSTELIDRKNNIYIVVGTELILSIEEIKEPLKSTYVGKRGKHYIVITPPANFSEIETVLWKSKKIEIKYLYEGNILGFSTKLNKIVSAPLQLLLMEYPLSVDREDARSHKRISCFISAQVELDNETKGGVIKDISKRGCHIVFELSKNQKNLLQINDTISLNFSFPGIIGRKDILGRVKDIQAHKTSLRVGIEFADIAWWVPPYA